MRLPISGSILVAWSALIVAGCASSGLPAPIVERTPASRVAASAQSSPAAPAAAPTSVPSTAAVATGSKPARPATQQPVVVPPVQKPPAPRLEPAQPQSAAVKTVDQPTIAPYREGDWRPEYYVVKPGDTLYSIALDHGQDYRDIAAWNNLADPAYIQVGQRLRMFPPGGSTEQPALEPVALPPATLSPVKQAAPPARVIPTFDEPKVRRLAYSEQALAELTRAPQAKKPAAAAMQASIPLAFPGPTSATPDAAAAAAPKSVQAGVSALHDEQLSWEWPAAGKVIYGFGEGANQNQKGVGIEGKAGQPVLASAPGKVVYSGSGLRGYGKLIIIKHNATYFSVYAHNSQLLVKEGQMVAQGQKIAEMGNSDSDQVALHFEIRRLGKPIDPLKYLPEKS